MVGFFWTFFFYQCILGTAVISEKQNTVYDQILKLPVQTMCFHVDVCGDGFWCWYYDIGSIKTKSSKKCQSFIFSTTKSLWVLSWENSEFLAHRYVFVTVWRTLWKIFMVLNISKLSNSEHLCYLLQTHYQYLSIFNTDILAEKNLICGLFLWL